MPRIYLRHGPHACPGTTTGRAQLPSCVTPSLDYYHPGSHAPPPADPRKGRTSRFGWLAHSGLAVDRPHAGTGISTRYPSTTPHGLALGPDSPRADKLDPGTLGHPAAGILTLHSLLMPAFSLQPPPPLAHATASPVTGRSPTHPHTHTNTPQKGAGRDTRVGAAASAVCLSPATLSAQNHLTSELLRTLSRMAASKPTSWLSTRLHILFHSAHTLGP